MMREGDIALTMKDVASIEKKLGKIRKLGGSVAIYEQTRLITCILRKAQRKAERQWKRKNAEQTK